MRCCPGDRNSVCNCRRLCSRPEQRFGQHQRDGHRSKRSRDPGSHLTITNTDRGVDVRVLTTNPTGFFTAGSLPLGTYTVKIANAGFRTEAVTGLVLNANDALTVNRSLVPGGASEIVTVTAAEAQLDMQDATSATLIDSTQINEMALITRNYETLLNLQPGVAFGGASRSEEHTSELQS